MIPKDELEVNFTSYRDTRVPMDIACGISRSPWRAAMNKQAVT